MLNNNNSFRTQMTTWSLKKNYGIFNHTLITMFHLQQWTQVSSMLIIIIQKISLMTQNIFSNIEAES